MQVAFNIPQRYLEEVRRQAESGDMRVAWSCLQARSGRDKKALMVYVVDDARARLRPVQILQQVEDLAVIGEGLKGGELVITELPLNLSPGKAVKPIGEPHS